MKKTMTSSALDIMGRLTVSKGKKRKMSEIAGKEVSYQPFVEEIVQEIQFTYTPLREKKSRKMVMETNVTGQ